MDLVVIKPIGKALQPVLQLVLKSGKTRLTFAASEAELTEKVSQNTPCVAVLSIYTASDLLKCGQFLLNARALIKKSSVRVVVISNLRNEKMIQSLQKRGCTEFILDTVPIQSIYFKLDFHLKAQIKACSVDAGGAIEIAQDVWLFRGQKPKMLGGQWALEVEGPDPRSGSWIALEDEGNGKKRWFWKSKKEDGTEISLESQAEGWCFSGRQPVYQEDRGKWKLLSQEPALVYRRGKEKVAARVEMKDGVPWISSDSPQAVANIERSKEIGKASVMRQQQELAPSAKKKASTSFVHQSGHHSENSEGLDLDLDRMIQERLTGGSASTAKPSEENGFQSGQAHSQNSSPQGPEKNNETDSSPSAETQNSILNRMADLASDPEAGSFLKQREKRRKDRGKSKERMISAITGAELEGELKGKDSSFKIEFLLNLSDQINDRVSVPEIMKSVQERIRFRLAAETVFLFREKEIESSEDSLVRKAFHTLEFQTESRRHAYPWNVPSEGTGKLEIAVLLIERKTADPLSSEDREILAWITARLRGLFAKFQEYSGLYVA